MLECGFSKPAKERIAQMQAVGMTDEQIIQAFVRDYGAGIYLAPPNAFGWIVPYASVGFGLVVIWLFIRKYRKPKPVAEIGPMETRRPGAGEVQGPDRKRPGQPGVRSSKRP